MTQPNIHLFHIGYSQETAMACSPGFELMDNRCNERPDWYEYWPIRKFLLNAALDDDAYYGFLSPRFKSKTNLDAAQVRTFIESQAGEDIDAFLFSAQPDVGMFFENVFVGGEQFNPGFLSVSQAVLTESGWGGDLAAVVMDSRTTVFSNYVVARPAFWRNWLRICECVFLLAEDSQLRPQLHSQLNAKTSYGAEAQRKIFVIEGIASLLLTIGGYKSRAFSPFAVPWFSLFSPFRAEALVADALKIAFRETGRQEYLAHFRRLQAQVLSDAIRARIDNVAPDCRATTA